MTAKPDFRLLEIDVLRGLAALAVVFSHYFPYWSRHAGPIPVLVSNEVGYWAVKLFFVISGFVIFFTLERCRTVTDFAVLRFSRLYPAYLSSLSLFATIGWLAGNGFWPGAFLANMTMAQQFLGFPHMDNVYWSLTVELAFYVNVAVLFAFGLLRRLHWIVAAWLVVSALWALGWHDAGSLTAAGRELVATDERDWAALLFALDYSPYFAVGISFYHARAHGWTRHSAVLLPLALGVEIVLAGWEGVLVLLACTCLFALAVNGQLRFVVGQVTLWLGSISYCLYLAHRNLGYLLLSWLGEHAVTGFVAIGIALACSLLVASALAFGIEYPASKRIRSWYRSSTLRPAASA